MSDRRELLVEAAVSAHRPARSDGQVPIHPAFLDLDAKGRVEVFEATMLARRIEAALHPEGLSTTALAVLKRIRSE